MRVIAFKSLKQFWENPLYSDAENSLRAWYQDAKNAHWKNSNEVKSQFKNASIFGNNRLVFNTKGNTYRLVVKIEYEFQFMFIRFIGTHKQYDKIDCKSI